MSNCPVCASALDPATQLCPRHGNTVFAPRLQPPPYDPLVGRTLNGRYRLLRRVGEGGVGVVYEGEHVEIRKPMAIKVLHASLAANETFRKRIEIEALSASRLTHPACVSVNDFGRIHSLDPPPSDVQVLIGTPYLVMEFVRGMTLLERLDQGPFDLMEAVGIAQGVLSALRHAHGLGLAHRDIKPANIMLTPAAATGIPVKLLDFGLAKQLEGERPAGAPITERGMVFGTPTYLSPEQASGRQADARSDLYSLGIVLFEMVCGRAPFRHENFLETVADHMQTPPPHPRTFNPKISLELEAAILKALEKDPQKRYASAQEFRNALASCPLEMPPAVTDAPPTPAAPVTTAPAPARHTRALFERPRAFWRAQPWRTRWILIAAAGLPIVAAAAIAFHRPARRPSVAVQSRVSLEFEPVSTVAEDARKLLYLGNIDRAIHSARVALSLDGHDGVAHMVLGAAYQRKLWCTDALDEFEKAVRDRPELRADPDLVRHAIGCLRTRTQARAAHFLANVVGRPANEWLRSAAATDSDPEIRLGAERALRTLNDKPSR